MEPITFDNVSFSFDQTRTIFRELSVQLPNEATAVVGPNGIGKSTFLLLAGARLLPDSGSVFIDGVDTQSFDNSSPEGAEKLNRLCSIVYQNMEFDTPEKTGDLLERVWNDGRGAAGGDVALKAQIINQLNLETERSRALDELSKGAMQRLVLAFALFYGSRYLILDEPTFAMEEYQKEAALNLVREITEAGGIPAYLAIHEIHLARNFSKSAILFHNDGSIVVGQTEDVLSDANIEKAYDAPMETLYQRERLWRDVMKRNEDNRLSMKGRGSVKVLE